MHTCVHNRAEAFVVWLVVDFCLLFYSLILFNYCHADAVRADNLAYSGRSDGVLAGRSPADEFLSLSVGRRWWQDPRTPPVWCDAELGQTSAGEPCAEEGSRGTSVTVTVHVTLVTRWQCCIFEIVIAFIILYTHSVQYWIK